MKGTTLFLAICTPLLLQAQHASLTSYTWQEKPDLPEQVRTSTGNEVLVERNVLVNWDDSQEGLFEYRLMHVRRYLRDAAAVEKGNRASFGIEGITDIPLVKARSIAPDGRIQELGADAFKRSSANDESGAQLYFAFEGLQPGSSVEYIVMTKRPAEVRGSRETVQFSIPTITSRFEVIVPRAFELAVRSYNKAPELALDTTMAGVNRYWMKATDVPGLEDEDSAFPEAYRMYCVYKLDRVPERSIRDYSGMVNATKVYHGAMYPELDARTKKELAKLIKDMDIAFARDDRDRVRTVEGYLKGNFAVSDGSGSASADLAQVLKDRQCSEFGMQRLFCNVLREAGIEHQLVLTSDRSVLPFDKDFIAFNYLQDCFLYLPKADLYVDPTSFQLRAGFLPPNYMENHGLFIRNVEMGGAFTGVGSVKYINGLPDSANVHKLIFDVALGAEHNDAVIKYENHLSGYYAQYVQPVYPYMGPEQQEELIKGLTGYLTENSSSSSHEVENADGKWMGVRPMVIKGTVSTDRFSSTAGDRRLFEVGELIGPQVEMYSEKPRQLPVDDEYRRRFDRTIVIHLPEGWSALDLHALEIDRNLTIDGRQLARFRSTARSEGRTVTLDIEEFYRADHVDLAHYEDYRSVVNAAADFNKAVLVLTR